MVKSPPANAGDTGLIPDPGRSHMPRGRWPGQASPYHEPSDRPVVGIQQERAQGADL